ncbi:MAG: PKD domain-containing protein [Candidatus Glassbacteria bacterium]
MLRFNFLLPAVLMGLIPAACSNGRSGLPPRVVVDLAVGDSTVVTLTDGRTIGVRLLEVNSSRDYLRGAVRESSVRVEVNGERATIMCGNYNLPVEAGGVRIDCPVTRDYYTNTMQDSWALEKDARIRLWPAGGPLVHATRFIYPVRQKWFANDTQMANEPAFVNGGEEPGSGEVYYHAGLDFGGCEGLTEVVAATAGTVIQLGDSLAPGYEGYPLEPRYDSIYVLGEYGWVYRYSHVTAIDTALAAGGRVEMGQVLARVGKEGNSGGWAHLHFEILSRQPSGRWGTEEGYAYVMEAYGRQYGKELFAVARPHRLAGAGHPVTLDGRRSGSAEGAITAYQWTFTDGSTAHGPVQEKLYSQPGTYSEVLWVTDNHGHRDCDFAVVQVLDHDRPDLRPPTIHAAYYPTLGIEPGQAVTFKVRAFNTTSGEETWDFGDGSAPAVTRSKPAFAWNNPRFQQMGLTGNDIMLAADGYATVEHVFRRAGRYLVRVVRTADEGMSAVAHLAVEVGGGE